MNRLPAEVHPHTLGIIWLCGKEFAARGERFRELDYLLDGLLIATGKKFSLPHLLVGHSFGKNFYALALDSAVEAPVQNLMAVVGPQITGEAEFIVIDELGKFTELQKITPEPLRSRLRPITLS